MQNRKKPRRSAALPSTAALWAQWRGMAAEIWSSNPHWPTVEVARKISKSSAGKKWNNSSLTYSVTYISKAIVSVHRNRSAQSSAVDPHASPEVRLAWNRLQVAASPTARNTANTLISLFRNAHQAAGSPKGSLVYHIETENGDHVFYLCPVASRIHAEILMEFPAMQLNPPMNLGDFTVVTW